MVNNLLKNIINSIKQESNVKINHGNKLQQKFILFIC